MLSVEQARKNIIERIAVATRVERVPLIASRGRYLGGAITSRVDNPAFDNSAMDGYALRRADLESTLPLSGESRCGDAPGRLAPGTAMRILTGAPVPLGADTVVMQEEVSVEGGLARFPASCRVGDNVRLRGEDFHAGESLYERGHRITAWDIALLASAGHGEIPVVIRPRALVVATGDELIPPGGDLRDGAIFESNRTATLALLEQAGCDVTDGGIVPDDESALRALLAGAGDYDFVVTSGGVSVGDYDHVKRVFAEVGEIHFWKVAIKPGKPIVFGRMGPRTHFFGLPGNPVSSLVTFRIFVEPALAAWHHGAVDELEIVARATGEFHRKAGREEFLRARLYREHGVLVAEVLKGQGSHCLGTIRQTNALIRIEAEAEGFAKGALVRCLPLGN